MANARLHTHDRPTADHEAVRLGRGAYWQSQNDDRDDNSNGGLQAMKRAMHAASVLEVVAGENERVPPALAPSVAVEMSDTELIDSFQLGDFAGFSEIYRRHRATVGQVCRRQLADAHLVEDAVQETFLRGFGALATFRGGVLLEHWLRRVARHVCIDMMKRKSAGELPRHITDRLAGGSEDAAFARLGNREAVAAILAPLGSRDSQLLIDRYADEVSPTVLAERAGMTSGAMRVTLHRALRRARERARLQGLMAFFPLPALRVLHRTRTTRWSAETSAIGGLTAAALPAVVALVLIAPLAVDSSAVIEVESAPTVQFTAAPNSAVSIKQPAVEGHDFTRSTTRRVDPPSDAPRRTEASRREDAPHLDYEDIAVPGTSRTVRNKRPAREPDYAIGVTSATRDGSTEVRVEVYDEPQTEPAHQAGCTAARAGKPVMFCERGGR